MLTSIGGGLTTTFDLSTPAGDWIGYQILIGTGRGSVLQMVGVFEPESSTIIFRDSELIEFGFI